MKPRSFTIKADSTKEVCMPSSANNQSADRHPASLMQDHRIRVFIHDFWALVRPFKSSITPALVWILAMQILALIEPSMIMYVLNGITSKDVFIQTHLELITTGMFLMLTTIGLAQVKKNKSIREVFIITER